MWICKHSILKLRENDMQTVDFAVWELALLYIKVQVWSLSFVLLSDSMCPDTTHVFYWWCLTFHWACSSVHGHSNLLGDWICCRTVWYVARTEEERIRMDYTKSKIPLFNSKFTSDFEIVTVSQFWLCKSRLTISKNLNFYLLFLLTVSYDWQCIHCYIVTILNFCSVSKL